VATKKELKLLTELLGIEGLRVESQRQYEGIGIILQVEAIKKESTCHRCGTKSSSLHQLGIDEIAMVKGQGKYCAVLVDIERGKLLAIIESRKSEEIEKVLKGWGEEVLERIEEVSIDL
jgi:transposase